MEKYVFREYDKNYVTYFEQEKDKLKKILGNVSIEHVGSTAVKGLGGKGIVDITVAVEKDNEHLLFAIKALGNNDYEYRPLGGSEDRWFFHKDYQEKGKVRRVHIHLTYKNSESWNSDISIRDHLIKHKKEREDYARIKKEGAGICKGDKYVYQAYKDKFLKNLKKKSLK